MFTLGIRQSLSQLRHRTVQRQEPDGQLRFFGLLLLVFGCPLSGAPLVFLLQVHLIERYQFAHPCLYYGVDIALTAGKVTSDVSDEVQSAFLAVHIELYTRSQCPDTRTNGRNSGHRQVGPHGVDTLFHPLRHLRQSQI